MMIYELEYTLEKDCIDSFGNIYPDEVLKMFQIAASEHADRLAAGFDAMAKRNLLWVVTQVHYEVFTAAAPGKVVLRTWPAKPTRLGLERDYTVLASDGSELIKGSSVWFLIDADTRKMSVVDDIYPGDEYYPYRNFEKRVRRLRERDGDKEVFTVIPDDSYIDGNSHVNNTKYAKLARIASGEYGSLVKSYQIDFLHEVIKGERIDIFVSNEEDAVLVHGECKEKGRAFICKASF